MYRREVLEPPGHRTHRKKENAMGSRLTFSSLFSLGSLAALLTAGVLAPARIAGAQPAYQVLHTFGGTDGAYPDAALIQASDGNFYGTTSGSTCPPYVCGGPGVFDGTIFKMTAAGTVTLLHAFTGGTMDGAAPHAALIQAADGNFYGTTSHGGPWNRGTVFKMTAAGTVTLLHAFAGGTTDGANPNAAVIQATDGNFYGTTTNGGASGRGTVFKITAAGTLTVLHAFAGGTTDGAFPYAALIQAVDGNFYGTTRLGGPGSGTVFKMTPAGTVTVLHAFTPCDPRDFFCDTPDAAYPEVALIQATDGNFYGTTFVGGAFGWGAVFKMTPAGTVNLLHSFTGLEDGANPAAALIQATDGNFYGTASTSVSSGEGGTVFKMTPAGILTVVHVFGFPGNPLGTDPYAALIQAIDGSFYGTTLIGGTPDGGVVFRLATPEPHLVLDVAPTVGHSFAVGGWAIDRAAVSSTGVDAVHVYAYPNPGSATPPVFLGVATYGAPRPDIGGRYGPRFTNSGFTLTGFGLAPGRYQITAFAHSAVSGTFNLTASASVTVAFTATGPSDFGGDGNADLTVFRSSTGQWFTINPSTHYTTSSPVSWGVSTDEPVPGDYDGDGKADYGVYRPSTGEWFIQRSSDGGVIYGSWGARASAGLGDIPVPGDYDGDGKTDFAVYRSSTGEWFIHRSSDGGLTYGSWGAHASAGLGDVPVPGDYDGDGKTDFAVYRASTGEWFIHRSSDGGLTYGSWGARASAGLGDVPVPGDYDGDGKTDFAVYRASTGEWFIHRSSDGGLTHASWGAAASSGLGDIPVPGDYDGDGMIDPAVYRRSTGQWFILKSSTRYTTSIVIGWGVSTDTPMNQRP
jgi:uncharacterized repeat protein (TIGR03803 family)